MTQLDKIEGELTRLRDNLAMLSAEVGHIRDQSNRLLSDQVSEKDTRRDRNQGFDDILHGKAGQPGLIVRVDRLEQEIGSEPRVVIRIDRLEQEQGRVKENRKHIIALWIAILVMILREIINSIGSP